MLPPGPKTHKLHAVAFVDNQVRVTDWLAVMVVGLAEMDTVGTGAERVEVDTATAVLGVGVGVASVDVELPFAAI